MRFCREKVPPWMMMAHCRSEPEPDGKLENWKQFQRRFSSALLLISECAFGWSSQHTSHLVAAKMPNTVFRWPLLPIWQQQQPTRLNRICMMHCSVNAHSIIISWMWKRHWSWASTADGKWNQHQKGAGKYQTEWAAAGWGPRDGSLPQGSDGSRMADHPLFHHHHVDQSKRLMFHNGWRLLLWYDLHKWIINHFN